MARDLLSRVQVSNQVRAIMKKLTFLAAVLGSLVFAQAAQADLAPPPGALIDVASITPTTTQAYVLFSANFTAAQATTYISFLFRRDPSYFGFDDTQLSASGGVNLLVDPGFESAAAGQQSPPGWGNFQQTGGIPAQGEVESGIGRGGVTARTGTYFWDDGAVGAYDGIYQQVATTIGQQYTLSFWLSNPENGDVYSRTGNGIDVLAYAGAALPDGTVVTTPAPPPVGRVPEPESLALLGLGAVAVAAARRRKQVRNR